MRAGGLAGPGAKEHPNPMAKLVAILATTHHPFYYRTSKLPIDKAPPFAAEWIRKVEAYRAT